MGKAFASFLLVSVATAVWMLWIFLWPVSAQNPPQVLLDAEAALFQDDLATLFYLDLAQALQFETQVLGEQGASTSAVGAWREPALLRQLANGGIDFRKDLDQLLLASTIKRENLGWMALGFGRFPQDRLPAALSKSYDLKTQTMAGHSVLLLTPVKPDPCHAPKTLAFLADGDRILVGDLEVVSGFLKRLAQTSGGQGVPSTDLIAWRQERQGKVLGFAVNRTANTLIKGTKDSNPGLAFAIWGRSGAVQSVSSVLGGVALEEDPVRLKLDMTMVAENADWPDEAVENFDTWRDQQKATAGPGEALVLDLESRINLRAAGERLRVEASFDRAFLQDAQRDLDNLLLSLIGLRLSLFPKGASPKGDGAAAKDQIISANDLIGFKQHLSPQDLKPYDFKGRTSLGDNAASGPFGISAEAFRVVTDGDGEDLLSVTLSVDSNAIANLSQTALEQGDAAAQAYISVSAIAHSEGRNLLRYEPCRPRDGNQDATPLQARNASTYLDGAWVSMQKIWGKKTLRLRPGVKLSQLKAAEGKVTLQLAIETKTLRLPMPAPGQVVQDLGVQFQFKTSRPNILAYNVNGRAERILTVRALNETGDYLQNNRSSASTRILGPGRSVTRIFEGKIAEVEIVLSAAQRLLSYPFKIEPLGPRFSKSSYLQVPSLIPANTEDDLDEALASPLPPPDCENGYSLQKIPPFPLCVTWSPDAFDRNLVAMEHLYLPKVPGLQGNLSALEIFFDTLDWGPKRNKAELGSVWPGFLLAEPDGDKPLLKAPGSHAVYGLNQVKFVPDEVTEVKGHLVLRIPRSLSPLSFKPLVLGDTKHHGNGTKVKVTGISDLGLELELQGARDRLVQVLARNGKGELVATTKANVQTKNNSSAVWTIQFHATEWPASLELIFAEKQWQKTYPFHLFLQPAKD